MNKADRILLIAQILNHNKPNIVELLGSNKPDAIKKINHAIFTNKPIACVVYVHKILREDQSFLIRWFQNPNTAQARIRAVPLHCGYSFTYSPLECKVFMDEYILTKGASNARHKV